jgi:subtilase family serine protease
VSFGSADGGDPTLTSGFETDFATAAHEGISLFAATGDTGGDASSGCTGGPEPEYPSTSPHVVAVGGTTVTLDRGVLGGVSGFSESAWDESGGGFSTQFAAPAWQEVGSAAGPIRANGHRGVPDVAASADYNFLYFDGAQEVGAGTSFASPLWAGMVTEMDADRGSTFGFFTPALYLLASNANVSAGAFHDITTGANCLGPAGPGWDTATGWGSPNGVLLYEHLVSSFVNITLGLRPSLVAPGGTVTISAQVANGTSGAAISGLSVLVTLSSDGTGGPCSGTFGTSTAVTNLSGGIVVGMAVPVCYLGSSAQATVSVANSGYYGVATGTVNVNLLGFAPSLAPLMTFPDNLVLFVVIMAVAITVGALLGRPPVRSAPTAASIPVAPVVDPTPPSTETGSGAAAATPAAPEPGPTGDPSPPASP